MRNGIGPTGACPVRLGALRRSLTTITHYALRITHYALRRRKHMEKNPLQRLADFGQSVWLDNIRRGLITSGELQRMIDEDGVVGVTANPTIFEKAISGSTDYDTAIDELVRQGRDE